MSGLDQELLQDIKKLDDVSFNAIITIMVAMVAGHDNQAALDAGNVVLIAAGRRPLTLAVE